MMFKVICEVSEAEFMKLSSIAKKIMPIYKDMPDENDVRWIHDNENNIVGMACVYVWDRYCEAFTNEKILSKNMFYKLVKRELNLKNKMMRLANDSTKYCFVNKST